MQRARIALPLFLIGIGLLMRLFVAFHSLGSNDVVTWQIFSLQIGWHGLAWTYKNIPYFNHPPLMGYLGLIRQLLASETGLRFDVVFKISTIMCDFFSMLLLFKIGAPEKKWTTVAAFSCSLIAILISAYHGNNDSMLALFCLLSAYYLDRQMPFASGLALSAAYNVKLIPIILIPVFLSYLRTKHERLKFLSGTAIGIIPFLPVFYCCYYDFFKNALAYNSNVENWGIDLLLMSSYRNVRLIPYLHHLTALFVPNGRYIILIALFIISSLSAKRRLWNPYELGFIAFAIFLILTPGFGIQYLVFVVPLLFAFDLRWGVIYSTLAGIFAGLVYYSFWQNDPGVPWYSLFRFRFREPALLFGLIVWFILIVFVIGLLRRRTPVILYAKIEAAGEMNDSYGAGSPFSPSKKNARK